MHETRDLHLSFWYRASRNRGNINSRRDAIWSLETIGFAKKEELEDLFSENDKPGNGKKVALRVGQNIKSAWFVNSRRDVLLSSSKVLKTFAAAFFLPDFVPLDACWNSDNAGEGNRPVEVQRGLWLRRFDV